MDLATHIPNIRRVYSRPWRDGRPANPSKVPTCIQVGVRPETTLIAHETVLDTTAEAQAVGAGLAGVGRIDIHDLDADGTSLVLDEGLQLPECPSMEPRAHALTRLDASANVRQVFHYDAAYPLPERRNTDEQMDVVGLHFLRDHRPAALGANPIEHRSGCFGHLPGQDPAAILRTPDHMVGGLVEAITIRDDIVHVSHGILDIRTVQAQCTSAIPPATEVAGFLAETL